jgi:hypothetical protein
MAVSFGFEVVPYGLSGEWRHGDNGAVRRVFMSECKIEPV